MRLYYIVLLYLATDKSYYTFLAGLWALPEMACGIIVASVPSSPKFFQAMKKAPSVSWISHPLRSSIARSDLDRRNTVADYLERQQTSKSNSAWTRRYQRVSDDCSAHSGQQTVISSGETALDGHGNAGRGGHEIYVMSTIDVQSTTHSIHAESI